MKAAAAVFITGDRELDRQLALLEKRDARRINRVGVNKGLAIIAKAIRRAAPVGKTRALKKDIGKRFARNRRSGEIEAKAGVGVGKKKVNRRGVSGRANHSHLVALGTQSRVTKSGASRGVMPANDFVTQAFASAQPSAASATLSAIRAGIEKVNQ